MLRVTSQWSAPDGAPYYTTMHFDLPAAGAQDAVDAVGVLWDSVQGWFADDFQGSTLPEVQEVDVATGDTISTQLTIPTTFGGTNSGPYVPFASQILWRWRTGVYDAGREIRGRTFVPGFATANLTDGKVNLIVVGSMTTALQDWLAGTGAPFAIYSPTKRLLATVSGGSVWSEFAILRSRRD